MTLGNGVSFMTSILHVRPSELTRAAAENFCKGDLISAKSDFQNFVREAKRQGAFLTSIEFAKHYIEEIGKKKPEE